MQIEKIAFSPEYRKSVHKDLLRDDIVSYLGEYRFKVKTYDYEILYSLGKDKTYALRDKYEEDTMTNKAKRAIIKNEDNGRSTRRETAELLGLISLESQIEYADDGDSILWVSPPGPKNEGYGDYGFIYIGSVERLLAHGKKILMTAVRIDNPTKDKLNFYLSLATGKQINFHDEVDFLKNPFVIKSSLSGTKELLFDLFNIKQGEYIQNKFIEAIDILSPFIDKFVDLTQRGAPIKDKKEVLNVLENLASEIYESTNYKCGQNVRILQSLNFSEAVRFFSYEPLKVAGSCGSSGGSTSIFSNNIFNSGQSLIESVLNNDHYEDYECPHCGKRLSGESKTDKSDWRTRCDHCGGPLHC